MINTQSTLRNPPDLCKNVSVAVLFDSDGNSYTVCTVSDTCVCVYIYIILYNINLMPTRNALSPLEWCFEHEQRFNNNNECLNYFILWLLWRLNSHSAWIYSGGNSQLTIFLAARLKPSAPLMTNSVIGQDQFLSRPSLFWDVTWQVEADYQHCLTSEHWTEWLSMLCNMPEEQGPILRRGGSLKYRPIFHRH
jgi:hypothetical protein